MSVSSPLFEDVIPEKRNNHGKKQTSQDKVQCMKCPLVGYFPLTQFIDVCESISVFVRKFEFWLNGKQAFIEVSNNCFHCGSLSENINDNYITSSFHFLNGVFYTRRVFFYCKIRLLTFRIFNLITRYIRFKLSSIGTVIMRQRHIFHEENSVAIKKLLLTPQSYSTSSNFNGC